MNLSESIYAPATARNSFFERGPANSATRPNAGTALSNGLPNMSLNHSTIAQKTEGHGSLLGI